MTTALKTPVLVVDDEEDWRWLLHHHLTAIDDINLLGTVNDAESALRVVENLESLGEITAGAVAIIDVRLPGMSGIDLADRLLRAHPALRIVLFTAVAEDVALEDARRVGVSEVLSKTRLRELPRIILNVASGQVPSQASR